MPPQRTYISSKLLWLIFILGAGLSLSIALYISTLESKKIISELRIHGEEEASLLHREVIMSIESLHALALLFDVNEIPSLARFSSVAKRILSRHTDIQALEWVPLVSGAERKHFTEEANNIWPGYAITQRAEQGKMVTANPSSEYYPVYYVEPVQGNEAAIGYNLAANPVRKETLELARDTGTVKITGSITLVQENSKQQGYLAFVPIYDGPSLTLESRRENLKGFVLGVFRLGDIFNDIDRPVKHREMKMRLIDKTSKAQQAVLHVYGEEGDFDVDKKYTVEAGVGDLFGRTWYLHISLSKNFVSSNKSAMPYVIGIFGALLSLFLIHFIRVISLKAEKITELSKKDGLTGINNRHHFNESLEYEWHRAIRNNSLISLIFIDIDFFKQYNDTYGHLAGDEALMLVAKTLEGVVKRPTDMVARYGGEEFIVLLPETKDAKSVAEICRRTVEGLRRTHINSSCSDVLTISLGVCTLKPKVGDNSVRLIECADNALYEAKSTGRNKVIKSAFSESSVWIHGL